MTLDELKSEYEVDASGRITAPGKLVDPSEKATFPALQRRKTVKLIEDDQGFVREV